MARALDREQLLAAFDEIGRAAVAAGTQLISRSMAVPR